MDAFGRALIGFFAVILGLVCAWSLVCFVGYACTKGFCFDILGIAVVSGSVCAILVWSLRGLRRNASSPATSETSRATVQQDDADR